MLCVIAIYPPAALPAAALAPTTRRLARVAAGSMAASVGLMLAVGLSGPSVSVPEFTTAFPWPPYFGAFRLSDVVVTGLAWLATGLGGLGLVAALLAVRRGWRPGPWPLLIGSLLAVAALTLMPPLGSTDMLDYAIYGRTAALGHSPYVMTPRQLTASGDPVGRFSPPAWRRAPTPTPRTWWIGRRLYRPRSRGRADGNPIPNGWGCSVCTARARPTTRWTRRT